MKFSTITSIVVLIAGLSSCRKVIQLDLHTAAQQFVIEGSINDQPGPYTISISKSTSLNDNNNFPKVSDAIVTITDINSNESDTLRETSPGAYTTSHITGITGHTYQLFVNAAGRIFKANSTMPSPVSIDSIYSINVPFLDGVHTSVVPVYTDPISKGNNYHYVLYINDKITKDVFILNDDYLNGTIVETPLIGETEIHAGDRMALCLQSVDPAIYNYYFRLSINKDVATPANPVTNITGGALGYFSAYSSSMSKTIIVR